MADRNDIKPIDGYAQNPHLDRMPEDRLYHFALGSKTDNLPLMFKDVKFVCMGGSPTRMERFASHLLEEMGYRLPAGQGLTNITCGTDRYAMYKVGPVLAVSHGIGIPSISVMLHELVKLLDHAGCTDVTFLRIGTSGGLGLKPGTVLITEKVFDGLFRSHQELCVMGKPVVRPAEVDRELVQELWDVAKTFDFPCERGSTMCTNDFYEEQGRLDGAICEFDQKDKDEFLHEAYRRGIRNIEMESLCFAAFTHHLKIRGAVMAVTLLDRFVTDQCSADKATLLEWELRLVRILSRFVVQRMDKNDLKPICSCLVNPHSRTRGRASRKART